MGCAGPEPNDCNYLNPSGDVLMWFFVTSIIYDAVLHFIIRAAFFTFYWSLSAQSNFRFWTGLGFGADVMLLIFNILIIVFRCQPTTANFRPLGRLTAQCMDSSFALFAPAAMVRPRNRFTPRPRLTSDTELFAEPLRSALAHSHLLPRPGAAPP